MRSKFTKIALATAFGLALALTFSCSGDGDGDDGGSSSSVASGCRNDLSLPVASGDDDGFGDDNSGANISNKVIYVDGSWSGSGDGTLSNPYRTIQEAIEEASDSEIDIIKIAQGTYREAVSILQKKVQLLGGFAGSGDFTSANPKERITIIEGMLPAPCIWVNIDQAIPGSLVISGFTIRGGKRGIELSGGWSGNLDNITIKNNIIEENDVRDADDKRGGGIGLEGTNVTIQGNLIRNNLAERGGAIGVTDSSTFNFLIADNHIENNKGYDDHGGGAIINGTGMITRNVFDGNVIDAGSIHGYGYGGGITVVNEDTTKLITLSHNVWRNNHAPLYGGAVFVDEAAKVSMVHELLYNNTSGGSGSAIYVDEHYNHEPSILYMDNCTVSGNTSSGAALYVQASNVCVQNSIFWNNGSDFEVVDGGHLTVNYTLTQQNFVGTGNISSDPLFTNASTGDFHLQSNSPAIDAGNPFSDFSKEPAPNGGRVNLGHYGNTAEASKSAIH
jgi:hypothetical protein